MKELAAGMLKVKNSKFYAHLYEIISLDEMNEIVKMHRKKYKKAVHHCWAAIAEGEKFHDDGEVGHPGRVILEVMKKYEMQNKAIVVSRIFGGVKLGVGGVSRAFREVAEAVAKSSEGQKE